MQYSYVVSRNFYWLSTGADTLDDAKSTWYVTPQKEISDYTLCRLRSILGVGI